MKIIRQKVLIKIIKDQQIMVNTKKSTDSEVSLFII